MDEDRYKTVQKTFESYGCMLLSTRDEIISMLEKSNKRFQFVNMRFVSKCGHVSEGYLSNLTTKGTGVNCRDCSRCIASQKSRDKRSDKDVATPQDIEYAGYKYFKDVLSCAFDVQKTNEGCIADFIVRPSSHTHDEWLMVQLKVTSRISFGQYCFSINKKNYDKCVMALICLDDSKTWLVDGVIASGMKNLNIGLNKSKYDQYSVSTDICGVVKSFYESKDLFSMECCMLPQAKLQQREQLYRSRIHSELPFLNIEMPEREGLKHDFMVNAYKVQEKVCGIAPKKNGTKIYSVVICASDGKNDGVRKFKPYKLGENDFYWIWIKDERCFFCHPRRSTHEAQPLRRQ